MLKKILLLNLVLLCSIVFSQQDYNKIKSLPPSSVKSLIDESNIKKEKWYFSTNHTPKEHIL